ncbi:TetR/AcrR family transcriptional regulator [Streptomyces sp. JW3]|uniref:TetR/AcrR family transcriptional regulator n=1 Tax=Streptomyces sp. JW3 TaxID=3456955 RepID=UPI003FA45215
MRLDAQRNRERILDAALRCFGRHGGSCEMATIAKEAGVGSATLFRHFPAKQALIEAVLLGCLEKSEEAVAEAQAMADPFEGLTSLLTHFVQSLVQNRNLHRFAGQHLVDPGIRGRRVGVFEGSAALLRRCQETGKVDADVQMADLFTLAEGIAEVTDSDGWQRPLALVIRGIEAKH